MGSDGAKSGLGKSVTKSRFSSAKTSNEKKVEKKSTKKISAREETTQFIKKQVGVDITKYIDEDYSNRTGVDLDWKKMTKNEQYAIRNLANKYKTYTLEDNGGLGMFMRFNRKR